METYAKTSASPAPTASAPTVVRSPFSDVDIPTVDVFTFIKSRFLQHPEDILFTSASSGEIFSAKRIVDLAERVASALAKRGFGKEDGLTVISTNCVEYAITCFATLALGGVFAPVYTSLDVAELKRQAEEKGAKVIACSSNYLETARQAFCQSDQIETLIVFDVEVGGKNDDAIPFAFLSADDGSAFLGPPKISADDAAIVQSSSGTTGSPKGIVHTHRAIVANLLQQLHEGFADMEPGDATMCQAPMAHVGGLQLASMKFPLRRANVVVVSDFDVARDLKLISDYRMKVVFLIGWHVTSIAKGLVSPAPDLSSVRTIMTGGAILSAEVENAFRDRTEISDIYQIYGLTEVLLITRTPSDERARRKGSSGIPFPNVEMKIVDPSTGSDLPSTSEGEVCVRSPSVMKGYLNAPEATASVFDVDGWFHTGDIGRFSLDGHLFITDRIKELIPYKDGQHVAPATIKAVLQAHPAVAECVVAGVTVKEAVEPRAFVVLKSDVAASDTMASELEAFVAARTSVLNRLRGGVRFVEAIPKSHFGKPMTKELKNLA